MAISQYSIQNWDEFTIPTGEGFTSGTNYPDPSSSEVRTQLQSQHSQMKAYINDTIVPAINNTYTKAETQQQINSAVIGAGAVTYDVVEGMIGDVETGYQTADSNITGGTTAFTTINLTGATIKVSNSVSFTIEVVS